MIRWGDPVVPGAPAFDFDHQTPEAQASSSATTTTSAAWSRSTAGTAVLMGNHEYTTGTFLPRVTTPTTPPRRRSRSAGPRTASPSSWSSRTTAAASWPPIAAHAYNRRITATTPFAVDGPAAGSASCRTSADPTGKRVLGTFGNCAGGMTPWGTILSGEENFNGYFAGGAATPTRSKPASTATACPARRPSASGSGSTSASTWRRSPTRFNRFGWVVEIDPYDKDAAPVKHTALGRFKHEGGNIRVAGTAGSWPTWATTSAFDYIYKYVSKNKIVKGDSSGAREQNKKLLSEGTLYVAKFSGNSPVAEIDGTGKLPADGEFDGTGEWIKLVSGDKSFVDGFTAEEVYVFTRLAARQGRAPRRWTAPRTSSPARAPARCTPR